MRCAHGYREGLKAVHPCVYRKALDLDTLVATRKGRYNDARVKAKHGDAGLPDLAGILSADCPKRALFATTERRERDEAQIFLSRRYPSARYRYFEASIKGEDGRLHCRH
jgi:hypothetical protein